MIDANIENFFREVRNKNELQSKLNEAYRKTLTLDFNPLNFVKWKCFIPISTIKKGIKGFQNGGFSDTVITHKH